MSDELVRLLQSLANKTARVECADGEIFIGELKFVDVEEKDVIYELVSTNRPRSSATRGSALVCKLSDIVKVESVQGGN